MKSTPKVLAFFILIGILDTLYLVYGLNEGLNCSIFEGCGAVTQSIYNSWLGIQWSSLGLAYYLLLLILFFTLPFERGRARVFFWGFTWCGLIASLWLTYLQIMVLSNFCSYCLISGISSLVIFILAGYLVFFDQNRDKI